MGSQEDITRSLPPAMPSGCICVIFDKYLPMFHNDGNIGGFPAPIDTFFKAKTSLGFFY